MNSDTAVGIFMLVTAGVVLVPVLLQLRDGRFRFREVWGIFVLIAGFAIVGVGYAFFDGDARNRIAIAGLAAVVFGLFAQHKWRHTKEPET